MINNDFYVIGKKKIKHRSPMQTEKSQTLASTEMEYRLTWLSYWYTDMNSAQKTMD